MNEHDIFFSKSSVLDLICFDLSRTENDYILCAYNDQCGFFKCMWKRHPFRWKEIQEQLEFWWSRNFILNCIMKHIYYIFAPMLMFDYRFTHQNRCRPPSDFSQTSTFSSIVHLVHKAPFFQFLLLGANYSG